MTFASGEARGLGGVVTDIYFSYSSSDRERVALAQAALTERGFNVLWDLHVAAGIGRDRQIEALLDRSRCVIVFWTSNSAASVNVRREVAFARERGKLLQVLLEPMDPADVPIETRNEQSIQLAGWRGDIADHEWQKLIDAVEDFDTPNGANRKIRALDAGWPYEIEITARPANAPPQSLQWSERLLVLAVLSAALAFLPQLLETALLHWNIAGREYEFVDLLQKLSFFAYLASLAASWMLEEEVEEDSEGRAPTIVFGVLAGVLLALNWAVGSLVPFEGWWQLVYLLPPLLFGLLAASFLSEVAGKYFVKSRQQRDISPGG